MQFIDLKSQYQINKADIDARIQAVLSHGQYILGPEVRELEQQLADYCQVPHCVAVANGTDALQLALMAYDIGPGDAVFTTTFSFFATAEVISLAGATPVFVDIDPDTYNISLASLKEAITAVQAEGQLNPKAVIAVDLFGLPADYPALQALSKENGLVLIEDAAQGFGGKIAEQVVGSFGDIATTSFFPAKPLGCYGDGGALFCRDDEVAAKLKSLRVHGKGTDKYDNIAIGMNSRLDTLQAAVLLGKLAIFEQELSAKQAVAEHYNKALKEHFVVPQTPKGYRSAWAQYCLIPKQGSREHYMAQLKEQGIPTAIYYGRPLHQQPVYQDLKQYVDLQQAERVATTIFSLPMHAYMSEDDGQRIVSVLLESALQENA